jgi:hypothetical protein
MSSANRTALRKQRPQNRHDLLMVEHVNQLPIARFPHGKQGHGFTVCFKIFAAGCVLGAKATAKVAIHKPQLLKGHALIEDAACHHRIHQVKQTEGLAAVHSGVIGMRQRLNAPARQKPGAQALRGDIRQPRGFAKRVNAVES